MNEFEGQRPRLFGLAYRLLGSAVDAEDAVQDTYLRWSAADHSSIQSPGAWLAKVLTNLCLNRLTSARATREQYVGSWLPEPLLTAMPEAGGGRREAAVPAVGMTSRADDMPLETVERRDSISMAFLVLLERLSPAERAVFVLREAFSYGHREIAEVLELSEANCRQLYRRAQQRVGDRRRFEVTAQARRRIVERFLAAAATGDLAGLEQVLVADVTAWSDGGGRVSAARHPIQGAAKVARFVAGIARKFEGAPIDLTHAEVNGDVAVLASADGVLLAAFVLETDGERILALRSILNPDKLSFLAGQLAR